MRATAKIKDRRAILRMDIGYYMAIIFMGPIRVVRVFTWDPCGGFQKSGDLI